MSNLTSKLTSRKFWLTVAAILASLGSAIGGAISDNEFLVAFGVVCTSASAGIYAFAEAWVDAKTAASTTKTISASTTAKDVVEGVLKSE